MSFPSHDEQVRIVRSISEGRLAKYLDACSGNLNHALSLYEFNCRLSEGFYTTLQGFEICLRNHLAAALQQEFGADWLVAQSLPFDDKAWLKIAEAQHRIMSSGKALSSDRLISELSLGFWVALLSKRYDGSLWRRALYRCFRTGGAPRDRFSIHQSCYEILMLRNRVAHHEPIFDRDPIKKHSLIIDVLRWMCPATALWVARRSQVSWLTAAP